MGAVGKKAQLLIFIASAIQASCAHQPQREPAATTHFKTLARETDEPKEKKGFFSWFRPRSKVKERQPTARDLAAIRYAMAHKYRKSKKVCYRKVKDALLAAGLVTKDLVGGSAKTAGAQLLQHHYKKIAITNPYLAPVGAVLVYTGGKHGHIEIRTPSGFVSDYYSPNARTGASQVGIGRGRQLIGVYIKD